jgi:hypothetical protein
VGFQDVNRAFKLINSEAWPQASSTEAAIKIWANERRGEKRICLWLEDAEYLVILAERKGYVLLWTAFMVDQEHTKRKLRKEYDAARKS